MPVRALPAPPNILALKFGSCSSGCASAVGPWCLRLLAQGSNPAASCTTLFPGFTSLLALCGPESRTPAPAPAFHGPAHTRPRLYLRYLIARVSSCLPPLLLRRICCDLRPGGALRLIAYLHQTPGIRRSRIIAAAAAAAPRDGPRTRPQDSAQHRTRGRRRSACTDSLPSVCCLSCVASLLARCGRMLENTALHSSSQPFQPS